MNPEELSRILDELGRRLGPTGEYVFELAVRQVYIEAIVALVTFVTVIAVGVIGIPRVYRWIQDASNPYSDRDMVGMVLGFAYIALLVVVIPFAFLYIPPIFNPEYAAIRNILSAVSGG